MLSGLNESRTKDFAGITLSGSRPLQKQILSQVQILISFGFIFSYSSVKNYRLVLHLLLLIIVCHFLGVLITIGEDDGTASVLGLCVRHADLLDRVSNSASSFGSPESRIGSPVESIDAWDSQL